MFTYFYSPPLFSPPLISRMVYVDVEHHVYLLFRITSDTIAVSLLENGE